MQPEPLSQIYDTFAESYDANRDAFDIGSIITGFQSRLKPQPGRLLDLGCGAGVPLAQAFVASGWQVTGVDFSSKMLSLANKNVPQMHTLYTDIRELDVDAEQYDAVTGIYSLFHIPRANHEALFQKVFSWLKPGGLLLFTYATADYTGAETFDGYKEFMGKRLFYSHDKPQVLTGLLEKLRFSIVSSEKHTIGGETFLWVTAEK